MLPLEPIYVGIASTLLLISFASLVNGIAVGSRRTDATGDVDSPAALSSSEGEFPQILKPGSPSPYVPRGFDALGLKADATPDEVLAAYRRLAIEAHPDHGGSIEKFTQLHENFELALAHADGRLTHPPT